MKYLKQKLMAAVAMLAVSTVMLTSASYAWFTISVTPEVQNIGTSINANENFEIALGTDWATDPDAYFNNLTTKDIANTTGDDHNWGATITSLTALGNGLGPAIINAEKTDIASTIYAADGRPAGLTEVTTENLAIAAAADKDGVAVLEDNDGNPIGYKIVLWVRSNVAGKVSVAVDGIKINSVASSAGKVQVAFQWNGGNIVPSVTNQTDGKGSVAELGEIYATGTTTPINTAIPVNMYIYLQGDKVSNADMAEELTVTIDKVTFTNAGIDTTEDPTDKYENVDSNDNVTGDPTPSN